MKKTVSRMSPYREQLPIAGWAWWWMGMPILLHLCLLTNQLAAQQRFADLGDFQLENGQLIQSCRIGYRTFGKLNSTRSNAILVPTWFAGTSADVSFVTNPGGVADSTQYFAIVVDALGDGISSSPSNSPTQAEALFPQFSIRDMVRSEYTLVTKSLGLSHVQAVLGISMGGMQCFEWLVTYPEFMDKVVSIIGTPKQGSYDLVQWGTELRILEGGHFSSEAMRTVGMLHELVLTTPVYFRENLKSEAVPNFIREQAESYGKRNPYDWASQLRAMLGMDIYRGKPMAELRSIIKAQLLVIVGVQDHMVTPDGAIELAQFLQVPLVKLDSACGHLSIICESATITKAVRSFLAK